VEEGRQQRPAAKRSQGGAPVAQYRLYFLQSVDRLISHSHEFEAADDEGAIRISEAWREGRAAELWSGARKVKSWEADR
jgi:hypothetical protein